MNLSQHSNWSPSYAGPFQAITDPGRRQILSLLADENRTIKVLADNFEIRRPAVSKPIKILYEAGLITIEYIGRERHCILNHDGFSKVEDWLIYFDKFWNSKLDALGYFLEDNNK